MPVTKNDRPKICRIASLGGFDSVLAGRDFSNIFKNGHVYDVKEVEGMILLTDLGEHGDPFKDGMTVGQIIVDGQHLLTKKEQKGLPRNFE